MTDIKDIKQKYLRLVEIYADKNLDNNSAEAKQILAELASENPSDYRDALKLAKGGMTPMQKFAAPGVEHAVTAARKNAQKAPEPQTPTQPQPQTQAPAQPQPQAKKDENKKTAKNTKPSAKKTDEKPTRPLYDHTLPEDVAKGLRDYLYADADDTYSDVVDRYIAAKDVKPQERVSHALNIVDFMRDEFKKRPEKDQPYLNRQKLAKMAAILYYANEANPKVAAKVEKFLARVSLVSANDYLRAVNGVHKRRPEDKFLKSMAAAQKSVVTDKDDTSLWHELTAKHIQSVLEKIEKQENKDDKKIQNDKIRYARLLRDNDFGAYIPDELLSALEADDKQKSDKQKQTKDKKSESNTGDKPMTDTNEEVTGTPTETEEEKKKKEGEEKTDTNKFNPSEVQKKACAIAGLDATKYENKDQLNDALLGAGVIINGEQILIKDGSTDAIEKAKEMDPENKDDKVKVVSKEEFDKAKKEMLTERHKDKPLNIKETGAEEEKEPQIDRTWIEKKVENYKAMEAENKIGKINITQGLNKEDKEFEVEVDGGTIHYSSPNSVSISNDAQIKTFEAVLMEDDNVGRPINFGENMPHDMAIRLAAACALHGNKMIGSFPQELTDADKALLKSELGERYEQFAAAWENRNKPAEEKKNDGKEEPKEEHKEDHKKDRAQISTPEELGKAVESLEGIKEKFEQMKNDGLIAVSTNLETKKPEIVAGPAMKDKTEEEQKKVVDDANALIASAAAIVQSSKTVSGKLNEEQAKQNNEFNEARLQHVRDSMDQKKLAAHDKMRADKLAERAAKDKDMAIKLGILPPEGENKALEEPALKDYIEKNNVNKFTYGRLQKKFNDGKEMTDAQKEMLGKLPDAPKMKDNSREK